MAFWSGLSVGSNPLLAAGLAAVGMVAAVGSYVVIFGDDGGPGPAISSSPVAPQGQSSKYSPTMASSEPSVLEETETKKFGSTDETGGTPPSLTVVGAQLRTPSLESGAELNVSSAQDLSVSAIVVGNQVVASADPNSVVGFDTSSAAIPEIGAAATNITTAAAPRFDLVRIDKYGGAVVAGKTEPGLKIQIMMDGEVIADVVADAKGSFVALFDVPPSQEPQVLSLRSESRAGQAIHSTASVIVMGREVVASDTPSVDSVITLEQDLPPAVIIATQDGIEVIQPIAISEQAPDVQANVTIDVISYDAQGEVFLTGRSTADKHVRVYVNDQPIKTEAVNTDGTWTLTLPEVDAGRYTLRVDEIDSDGLVVSRVETPFQKEAAEDVVRTASVGSLEGAQAGEALPYIQKITVQPGATLWALAKSKYGDGRLYIQIVQANRENIKNPDLIYPGQIFEIPD